MKRKTGLFVLCIIAAAIVFPVRLVYPSGASESAASATRGRYLAERGIVIEPQEVHVDSYIASVDYGYPDPDGAVGVTLLTGNHQVPATGGDGLLQIGVQGQRRAFEDLPPLNIAFVIDRSGSMAEEEKLNWVKDSFDVLIDRLRDGDFVSVVAFAETPEIIVPSTRIESEETRRRVRAAVRTISAGGETDMAAGLTAAYEQILTNFRGHYTNRVFLLSDGTEIAARLARAGAQSGDVRVTLIWDNRNDLDLHVVEPSGERIFFANPRSGTGGQLDVDMNVNGESNKPVENIFWPEGKAPTGTYQVFVRNFRYHEHNRTRFPFTVQVKNGSEITQYDAEIVGTAEDSDVRVAEFVYPPAARSLQARTDILETAAAYRGMDVYLSTVGVGVDFDLELMRDLARAGGGSSRFISSRDEMVEVFGKDLDRTAVPAAHNLEIELTLSDGVQFVETWGYEYRIRGNTVVFSLPTLHNRDYETILVRYRLPGQRRIGPRELAEVAVAYDGVSGGGAATVGPYWIGVTVVDQLEPVVGYSDATVLRSGTILDFAEGLIEIGDAYYSAEWNRDPSTRLQEALDRSVELRRRLANAALRLGSNIFDDEVTILDAYLGVIARSLEQSEEQIVELRDDTELPPPVVERSIHERFDSLFDEIILALESPGDSRSRVVAPSGFAMRDGSPNGLVMLLNELGALTFSRVPGVSVVERDRLDAILEEQRFSLSGLADTDSAVTVGKLLAADYLIAGTVLPTERTVVVFGRLVNVNTGKVESVAQVIVPRDDEVNALLKL